MPSITVIDTSTDASTPLHLPSLVGESHAYKNLLIDIEMAARTRLNVLLVGEHGTGKSVHAAQMHSLSGRAGPLVWVTCATLAHPENEVRLFGRSSPGLDKGRLDPDCLIAHAHGGTLVLDDVEELPPSSQARLVHLLKMSQFQVLTTSDGVPLDVRLISTATESRLEAVQPDPLRADLLARVRQVDILVPPVHDRGDDVLLLARHILQHHPGLAGMEVPPLSEDIEHALLNQMWRGNILELEHLLCRLVIEAEGEQITGRQLHNALCALNKNLRFIITMTPKLSERTLAEHGIHALDVQRALADLERDGHIKWKVGPRGNPDIRAQVKKLDAMVNLGVLALEQEGPTRTYTLAPGVTFT